MTAAQDAQYLDEIAAAPAYAAERGRLLEIAQRIRVASAAESEVARAREAFGCEPGADIASAAAAVLAEARDYMDALSYLQEIAQRPDGFWHIPPVLDVAAHKYGSRFIGSVLAAAAAQDAIDDAICGEPTP